ncbi:hypothetical protein F2Q68_00011142 [Brassica cretica]|uniref:Uncharacterized protein n=1 Tax=Brassica cretica TaxID=69181 RepID=A0A8S9KPZ2_BRACR|nr:hypothetical protein F2Q68_00011142 [Brassica cretica]
MNDGEIINKRLFKHEGEAGGRVFQMIVNNVLMSFFVTWLESLYSKSPRLAQTQYAGFGNHFKCHSGLLRAFHSVYGQTRVVLVRWGTFATTPLAAEQYSFFPCTVFDVRMENGVDLQQTPTDDHPPQLQELPFSLPPYPRMIMDAIEATNGCNKTAIPDPNAPPKRGRGRPPKPKPEGDSSHVAVVPAPTPRPRGRPPDS